jgi:sortase A
MKIVARKQYAEDLTVDELRRMLIDRRRGVHQKRVEHFRRTGRISPLTPDTFTAESKSPLAELKLDEDPEEAVEEITLKREKPKRKRMLERFLYAVEIIAVVGLLFVLFNGLNLLRTLNKEVASALQQPGLTPTPLISAVVLPSGHTPPNAAGGAVPNDAEIPEHLRPLVQSLANLPAPTPGPEQAIRIQIPAINVDAPVVQGDGWEQLKKGVGQHIGTVNPGQNGNMVLSAHNDIFGEIFRDLDKLKIGDQITLFTNQRNYVYIINNSQIVDPGQVEVMAATTDPTITLISCYPYMVDNKRIVITARLQNTP